MSDDIRHIDIKEFREEGFLQEANRQFFHPLGLALEVVVEDDGSERLGGVWDYRDDPEGMIFSPGLIDPDKVSRIDRERRRHWVTRANMFKSDVPSHTYADVQPYDWSPDGEARDSEA